MGFLGFFSGNVYLNWKTAVLIKLLPDKWRVGGFEEEMSNIFHAHEEDNPSNSIHDFLASKDNSHSSVNQFMPDEFCRNPFDWSKVSISHKTFLFVTIQSCLYENWNILLLYQR